jgi:type I restriction enzyme S subunit
MLSTWFTTITESAAYHVIAIRDRKIVVHKCIESVLLSDEGYANLSARIDQISVSRKYVSYVGNPKLMNNVMAEISIIIPVSVEEQQKISNFLKSLNVRIKQLEIEISKIENWKKGLLQKMFC